MKLKAVIKGKLTEIDFPFENRKPTPQEQIAKLKLQLSEDDYKIIKCKEYEMVGKTIPYDVKALSDKRDKIRDEINRLEKQINEHSGGETK